MTRAGAADTSTEPSTSQAEGAKREGEPIPTGPPSSVARGKSDGTSVTTTETHEKTRRETASRSVDRDANAEDGGAEPPNASQKKMTKTKMGTNLYDVSWSLEEQNTLEDGLLTYAEGAYDSLWRYVKIAANLPAKGVRDVALRVRWMKRKRAGEKTSAKRRKASGASGAGASGAGAGGAGAGGAAAAGSSSSSSSSAVKEASFAKGASPAVKPRSSPKGSASAAAGAGSAIFFGRVLFTEFWELRLGQRLLMCNFRELTSPGCPGAIKITRSEQKVNRS